MWPQEHNYNFQCIVSCYILWEIIYDRNVGSSLQTEEAFLYIKDQYMKVYNINASNVTMKYLGKIIWHSIICQYIWG